MTDLCRVYKKHLPEVYLLFTSRRRVSCKHGLNELLQLRDGIFESSSCCKSAESTVTIHVDLAEPLRERKLKIEFLSIYFAPIVGPP